MTPKVKTSPGRVRVYLVDDHPMTRYGLAQIIAQEPDLEVCGEADSADKAMQQIQRINPDLLLTDLTLPGRSGLEFIKDVKAILPAIPVLVVSMHDEALYAERTLRAGANGYLMKSAGGSRVIEAIRRVLSGQVYVSEAMANRILDVFAGSRSRSGPTILGGLTDREFEILQLVGEGMTTSEIAANLRISGKTVETHRLHIREKLKLKSAPELLKFAVHWKASQDTAGGQSAPPASNS